MKFSGRTALMIRTFENDPDHNQSPGLTRIVGLAKCYELISFRTMNNWLIFLVHVYRLSIGSQFSDILCHGQR